MLVVCVPMTVPVTVPVLLSVHLRRLRRLRCPPHGFVQELGLSGDFGRICADHHLCLAPTLWFTV